MSLAALPIGEPALAQQQSGAMPATPPPPRKRMVIASRDTVAQPEPR